mmetsp:Transcript_124375/g.310980  ORF Transcript_124375/g.310980 Transcript_124375/m.310980 type:complete len:212 (+) Transcript_124375:468-1103(+)
MLPAATVLPPPLLPTAAAAAEGRGGGAGQRGEKDVVPLGTTREVAAEGEVAQDVGAKVEAVWAALSVAKAFPTTKSSTLSSSSSSSIGNSASFSTDSTTPARGVEGNAKSSSNAAASGVTPQACAVEGDCFEDPLPPANCSLSLLLPFPSINASASKIQGESWPPAKGETIPELTTEVSADVLDFAPRKFGVLVPNPGVPAETVTAEPPIV